MCIRDSPWNSKFAFYIGDDLNNLTQNFPSLILIRASHFTSLCLRPLVPLAPFGPLPSLAGSLCLSPSLWRSVLANKPRSRCAEGRDAERESRRDRGSKWEREIKEIDRTGERGGAPEGGRERCHWRERTTPATEATREIKERAPTSDWREVKREKGGCNYLNEISDSNLTVLQF